MGFKLSDTFVDSLNQSVASAVNILSKKNYNSKIRTRNRVNYPVVTKGKWQIFLLFDTGMGWACPLIKGAGRPHWDWFMSQNLDMVNSSILSGLSYALLFDPTSVDLMVETLDFILQDPCSIPNAVGSAEFLCPECSSDWNTIQEEIGIVGRLFEHKYMFSEVDPSNYPNGLQKDRLMKLFGTRDYAKYEND